jgi:hypothetical protein
MAETIQEMIARKRKEKAEGKKEVRVIDNAAARSNLNTEVSTAKRAYESKYNNQERRYNAREVVSMQDEASKGGDPELSTGQKLMADRKKRAKAKEYIEANSK